jgi:hypothetical protein
MRNSHPPPQELEGGGFGASPTQWEIDDKTSYEAAAEIVKGGILGDAWQKRLLGRIEALKKSGSADFPVEFWRVLLKACDEVPGLEKASQTVIEP